MLKSKTSPSVTEFLVGLTAERRKEVEVVRALIRKHIPSGYEETIVKNMLVYQVPWEVYSDTYNGQPLWYVALASAKWYLSLHLMPVYCAPKLAKELADGFKEAGKKLDIGKACIHFHSAQDLALDVIGGIVAKISVEQWVAIAKAARSASNKSRKPKK